MSINYTKHNKLDMGLTCKPTHGRVHKCHSHIYVDIELRYYDDNKIELGISADMIGYGHYGQCLDTIDKYGVKYKKAWNDIYKWWNLYHLNGLHAECEHQHELGWHKEAAEPIAIYNYVLKQSAYEQQERLKKYVVECAKYARQPELSAHDRALLALEYSVQTDYPEPPNESYECTNVENKTRGWVNYSGYDTTYATVKSERGLIGKPCPVCGYRYGTAWKYRAIPENVLKDIEDVCNRGLKHWYAEN